MEQAASEVVSCLSLEVCKEKHNMGKGILSQSEGRLGLKILLPKLQCHSLSLGVGLDLAVWPRVHFHPLWALGSQCEVAKADVPLSVSVPSEWQDSPRVLGAAGGSRGSHILELQVTSVQEANRMHLAAQQHFQPAFTSPDSQAVWAPTQ